MTQLSTPPQPTIIEKLRSEVPLGFAMLTGLQLDLFTHLEDGARSAEQLADALGVGAGKLRPLLYTLVVAELLTESGGRFANSAEANHYLVRSKPSYIGGVQHILAMFWAAELKTAETIRTGIPQAKVDWNVMPQERLELALRGLLAGALASGRELARRYDFSAYHTVLDVGGGSGGLAIALTEACPHLHATVVELPNVTPIAQKIIAESDAAERVSVIAVDVVRAAPPGSFDVAVLKNFVQVLSPEEARQACVNVGKAIRNDGTIYVYGSMLDNSRRTPLAAVTQNLFFINAFDAGQSYTEQECADWLTAAECVEIERTTLPDGSSIMRARKQI